MVTISLDNLNQDELNSEEEQQNRVLSWMENRIFKKEEFKAIIEQADEWGMLAEEEKEEILTAFNGE